MMPAMTLDMKMIQSWCERATMIQVTADTGAERRRVSLTPSFMLTKPPARQPMMFPMKNKLAIQEPEGAK